MRYWNRILLAACAIGSSPFMNGCSSLPMTSPPLASCTDPVAVARGDQGMVVVEVRAEGTEPKMYQMPLEGEMHVQDAVEKSRAKRKFRRMHVSVMRTSPEGRRHKMECRYESAKRRVAIPYDYALQPGDYIVIAEDTSTILDDIFEEISGPTKVFTTH